MPHARTLPIDAREVLERVLPRRPATVRLAGAAPRPRPRPAAASELLMRLPADLLRATAERCPSALEAIARDWADPRALHATLDALAAGAHGPLPAAVRDELAELRRRHERWVGPPSPGRPA